MGRKVARGGANAWACDLALLGWGFDANFPEVIRAGPARDCRQWYRKLDSPYVGWKEKAAKRKLGRLQLQTSEAYTSGTVAKEERKARKIFSNQKNSLNLSFHHLANWVSSICFCEVVSYPFT